MGTDAADHLHGCSIMREKERPSPESALSAQAFYWVARIRSGECSEEQRAALDAWLAQSPEHRKLYHEVSDTWDEVNDFTPSIAAEIEEARAYSSKRRSPFPLAMAATVLVILAVGFWFLPDPLATEIHRTAKGEQKELVLADGSHVLINTDTELRVEYSKRMRAIYLERGEALFTVADGDERPFDVLTRGGRIRDVSTRFNVRRDELKTSVIVLDGMVIVTTDGISYPQPVSAGEGFSYLDSGKRLSLEKIDAHLMTAWSNRQLVLRARPLQEVAKEISRYHDVSIMILGDELQGMKVSGIFDMADLQGFLNAIEVALPVSVERNGQAVVLSRRGMPEM